MSQSERFPLEPDTSCSISVALFLKPDGTLDVDALQLHLASMPSKPSTTDTKPETAFPDYTKSVLIDQLLTPSKLENLYKDNFEKYLVDQRLLINKLDDNVLSHTFNEVPVIEPLIPQGSPEAETVFPWLGSVVEYSDIPPSIQHTRFVWPGGAFAEIPFDFGVTPPKEL